MAAVDEDVAREVIDLIRVEYNSLQGVFDPFEALCDEVSPLHEGGNLAGKYTLSFLDVQRGMQEADLVLEEGYRVQIVQHCTAEEEGVRELPHRRGRKQLLQNSRIYLNCKKKCLQGRGGHIGCLGER